MAPWLASMATTSSLATGTHACLALASDINLGIGRGYACMGVVVTFQCSFLNQVFSIEIRKQIDFPKKVSFFFVSRKTMYRVLETNQIELNSLHSPFVFVHLSP